MRHELKTWPDYYESVRRGAKSFEVRVDDRGGFGVGDVLVLHEWSQGAGYTGRSCEVVVTYVMRGPAFGVADGYVVMGFAPPAEALARRRHLAISIVDSSTIVSLWAALISLRAASWPVAVAFQVLATVLVGASLVARGRSR